MDNIILDYNIGHDPPRISVSDNQPSEEWNDRIITSILVDSYIETTMIKNYNKNTY